jgi:nucleoside-diphosphate-sugar epimerase
VATLLTGAGYIGAALVRRLASDAPLVVLENFFCTSRAQVATALPAHAVLVEGDVADRAAVAAAFAHLGDAPATVFHLAAQPSAAIAAREPALTERSNLVGARVLLDAAKAHGARVIFGGSLRVYGDAPAVPIVDEATPYGRVGDLSHLSKIYVEQLARMAEVPFVSVRLGVTYGLSPIMKTDPPFMTVPNLFCQRAAHGAELRVLENRPLGFVHVTDAADALLAAADRQQRLGQHWEALNVAPEVATVGEVAQIVADLLAQRDGRAAIAQPAVAGPGHARFTVTSRLGPDDGFTPHHSLDRGLGDVLDFFLEKGDAPA